MLSANIGLASARTQADHRIPHMSYFAQSTDGGHWSVCFSFQAYFPLRSKTYTCAHMLYKSSDPWCIACLLAITKFWHSLFVFLLAHHLLAYQQFICTHRHSSFAAMRVVLLWMLAWLNSCNQAFSGHQLLAHSWITFRDTSASVFRNSHSNLLFTAP